LQAWERLRGVTVFRGISGFGDSGSIYPGSSITASLSVPVVVEFFDSPEKIAQILVHLEDILPSAHVLTWSAEMRTFGG